MTQLIRIKKTVRQRKATWFSEKWSSSYQLWARTNKRLGFYVRTNFSHNQYPTLPGCIKIPVRTQDTCPESTELQDMAASRWQQVSPWCWGDCASSLKDPVSSVSMGMGAFVPPTMIWAFQQSAQAPDCPHQHGNWVQIVQDSHVVPEREVHLLPSRQGSSNIPKNSFPMITYILTTLVALYALSANV